MTNRISGDRSNRQQVHSRNDQKNKSHALRAELTMTACLRETRDTHPYTRPITVTKKGA